MLRANTDIRQGLILGGESEGEEEPRLLVPVTADKVFFLFLHIFVTADKVPPPMIFLQTKQNIRQTISVCQFCGQIPDNKYRLKTDLPSIYKVISFSNA